MSRQRTNRRFSRERLAGYNPTTLASARVAVVGAGALGQNALLCLALSGVGEVAIVDYDQFEESNRTRSPFFVPGAPKARAVGEGWLRMATAAEPRAWAFDGAVQEFGDLVVQWADIVVAAVDRPSARAYLAERCRLHRRPLVEAGFVGHTLSLSAFRNQSDDEPCWRCGKGPLHDQAGRSLCSLYARNVEAAGAVPAVQSVAQAAGALVAEAAIAGLHDEFPLGGHRMSLDTRSGRAVVSSLPLDPACSGIHRPIVDELVTVPVESSANVRRLLEFLISIGPNPEVFLPDTLVRWLPCVRCGRAIPIDRPRWAVTAPPRCEGRCRKPVGTPTTRQFVSILDETAEDELTLTCTSLGLGTGSVFTTAWSDGRTAWCRMPGAFPSRFARVAAPAGAGAAMPSLRPIGASP